MNRKNALFLYLLGAFGQIWIVCMIVFMLRRSGLVMDYSTPMGMVAIGVGGISSALWGSIIAIRYKKYNLKKIIKDFFHVKQDYRSYLLVIFFLFFDFFAIIVSGKFLISAWYIPIVLFLKSLVFGGIEEIGWRYVFQPILQERYHYILSTMITFVAWEIWHYAFFYIDGSLPQIQLFEFSVGLLINCFILSALYIRTNSLWICVMTHALINVFSQLGTGGNLYVSYICKIIIIVTAVVILSRERKRD